MILQQSKAKDELAMADQAFLSIIDEIVKELNTVYDFEKILDSEFKKMTRVIHGEEYGVAVDFDEKSGISSVVIESEVTNPEGGKKKLRL